MKRPENLAFRLGTGLFGLAFIIGAAAIAPRLGIALFLSATIAGQLVGASPWKQQVALVIGVCFGSIVVPPAGAVTGKRT